MRREIQKALAEEKLKRGLTQSDIAREIGVHRSVINRELKGFKDMSLGRVGEIANALGRQPEFFLNEIPVDDTANYFAPVFTTKNETTGRTAVMKPTELKAA